MKGGGDGILAAAEEKPIQTFLINIDTAGFFIEVLDMHAAATAPTFGPGGDKLAGVRIDDGVVVMLVTHGLHGNKTVEDNFMAGHGDQFNVRDIGGDVVGEFGFVERIRTVGHHEAKKHQNDEARNPQEAYHRVSILFILMRSSS